MDESTNKKISLKIRIMLLVIMVLLVLMTIVSLAMIIIAPLVDMRGACWMRYNTNSEGVLTTHAMVTNKSINLRAHMNYKVIQDSVSSPGQTLFIPDPSSYGQWYDAGEVSDPNGFEIQIDGSVSLCKSYLPDYNIQQNDAGGSNRIEIPRVGKPEYLALRFPANRAEWRNLAEVTSGDDLRILVKEPVEPSNTTNVSSVVMVDEITKQDTAPVNCSASVTSGVSPICGRFSIYSGGYTSACESYDIITCASSVTCWAGLKGAAAKYTCPIVKSGNSCTYGQHSWLSCTKTWCDSPPSPNITQSYRPSSIVSTPRPYSSDTTFFYRSSDNRTTPVPSRKAGDYLQNFDVDCTKESQRAALPDRIKDYKFWMTHGEGMMYRYSNGSRDTVSFSNNTGTFTTRGKIRTNDGNEAPGYIIFSDTILPTNAPAGGSSMFQMGYINNGNVSTNTGGYVIYVQHTKCKRANGRYQTDSFQDRGKILYYILPAEYDMNNLPQEPGFDIDSFQHGYLEFPVDGNRFFLNIDEGQQLEYGKQKLWLKINNKPEDYRDSEGQYSLKFNTKQPVGLFTGKVLLPIFAKVDKIIESAGQTMFKNLTCYGGDKARCINFFTYIKALLTIYVFMIALMFLMGRTQLDQMEFIKHVVKILIIAGLMNGTTFDYFRSFVFPTVMEFTDEIMANFGGYSKVNPFSYLDDALNKILLNKMVLFQMLALFSAGLTGVFMFFMTFIGIYVFLISAIQGIATYIFAKLILAFLLGIAPLFLVFMLFSPTRKFFQGWVNSVFRYTIEPVVITLGLAVFTKLFVLYLDKVLGYSVCFKCAIPFRVPNVLSMILPGFPDSFKDIYLFCLYWFGPWGIDSKMGVMSLGIPDIVGLSIIGFMCYTYVQFASSLVTSLTGSIGPSASSLGAEAGNEMVSNLQNSAKYSGKAAMYAGKKIHGLVSGRKSSDSSNISGMSSGKTDSSGGDSGDNVSSSGGVKQIDTSMKSSRGSGSSSGGGS
jgi:type IV secretion system protein VirB6